MNGHHRALALCSTSNVVAFLRMSFRSAISFPDRSQRLCLPGDRRQSPQRVRKRTTLRYKLSKNVKLIVDVFNLFDAKDSDIDYYDTSRLPDEPPGGINDIHFHPTLPRTARIKPRRRILIRHLPQPNRRK